MGFFSAIGKKFGRLAENARAFGRGERETEFDFAPPPIRREVRERVEALIDRINATSHGHGLADKLAAYVLSRQEVDVWSIRPLKLARLWGIPDRHAIELCLEAVVQGLLRLRWDLLCPRCQTGKDSRGSLDELPAGTHCSSCNIDYGREYTQNVELAFHPANAIRPLESGEYCLWGPMSTPHIKAQLTVAAGETRIEQMSYAHGRYRLRSLEPGPEIITEWASGGFPEVIIGDDKVETGAPASENQLVLINRSHRPLTFFIEELEWMRDALTAHRVTALQAFRDLFTEQVLRPGDSVEIDYITIMFTDLKGSTALYERIGDPGAYALVREHFAVLGTAVRECEGTVVKTIGDAIMAVFINPPNALRCAVQIHDDFEKFNATSAREPIVVKVGVHVGRCISVTLNDRLDYYGTAANMAARLQNQSQGGDIVVSRELASDPAVAHDLQNFTLVEEQADLKGFDEPIPYFRIHADELDAKRAASSSFARREISSK